MELKNATGLLVGDIEVKKAILSDTVIYIKKARVRYIRDHNAGGSSTNTAPHWAEIMAFSGGVNVALNKEVTASHFVVQSELKKLTDGNKTNYMQISSNPASSYVQVDLGASYKLEKIIVWHYWQDGRTYYGTKTEVSEDGVEWRVIFDSAVDGLYQETIDGKIHLL